MGKKNRNVFTNELRLIRDRLLLQPRQRSSGDELSDFKGVILSIPGFGSISTVMIKLIRGTYLPTNIGINHEHSMNFQVVNLKKAVYSFYECLFSP